MNEIGSGIIWRLFEKFGAQVVSFIVSVVLARMLSPESYGSIALVMVFISIFQVFVDFGLGNALIQKKDADDLDFSSVFYFNVVFCIFLYIVLYYFSPYISSYLNDNSLVSIIRVLGIVIIISGVKNVQQAYISKKLLFKKFFYATMTGTVLSAIVGILLAINGKGVWSIVFQNLTNQIVDTIFLWITIDWKPKFVFSFKRLFVLIKFGWKIFLSILIDNCYRQIKALFIGKIYNSKDLAFYNRGQQIPDIIVSNVDGSVDSVLFPVLSNNQNDKHEIKKISKKIIGINMFLLCPLMVMIICCAKSITILLLTEKWIDVYPYMQIFALYYLTFPFHTTNLNIIKALGYGKYFIIIEILKKIFGVSLLVAVLNKGPIYIALACLAEALISIIINSFPNKKLIGYGLIDQLKDIKKEILSSVLLFVLVSILNLINVNIIIKIIIQIVIGIFTYIYLSILLKNDNYYYVLDVIRKNIKSFRQH